MSAPSLTVQIFSSFGAFVLLLGYIGHQLHWINANKIFYNLLNFIGAGILAVIAFKPFQAGFFVMESVWTAVSLFALIKRLRRKNI